MKADKLRRWRRVRRRELGAIENKFHGNGGVWKLGLNLSTEWSFRVHDFRGRAILWNKMQDVASVRGLSELAKRGKNHCSGDGQGIARLECLHHGS